MEQRGHCSLLEIFQQGKAEIFEDVRKCFLDLNSYIWYMLLSAYKILLLAGKSEIPRGVLLYQGAGIGGGIVLECDVFIIYAMSLLLGCSSPV